MPVSPIRVDPVDDVFRAGFDRIRQELKIEDVFPPDVTAEAEAAARAPSELGPREDLRELSFVTIDPPGSTDLDQAMYLERSGDGWVVHYAIADVAAFVTPGSALDADTRSRGVTIYLPDHRTPLHPTVLSEGAASLLPGEERPALAWRIAVDGHGEIGDVAVRRAVVRSRRAYNYPEVQKAVDAGDADDQFLILRDMGTAREARQLARGGLDLRLPEQTIVATDGSYELAYRAPVAAEGWNAQVSLLTGECAAALMLAAGVGLLRTLPPPSTETVDRLRRHAQALNVAWPADEGFASFLHRLDPTIPDHAALLVQSAKMARGAGYVAFTQRPTTDVSHSAVTAPYAHVTAPLRRVGDRFANEVVLAAAGGHPPPDWATSSLTDIAKVMESAHAREQQADRMAVDLAEAIVMRACVGQEVEGVVVSVDGARATVQLSRPAVVTTLSSDGLALGDEVRLRVTGTDPDARRVDLVRA